MKQIGCMHESSTPVQSMHLVFKSHESPYSHHKLCESQTLKVLILIPHEKTANFDGRRSRRSVIRVHDEKRNPIQSNSVMK